MAEKRKETAVVVSQEKIASDVYSMWLQTEEIAKLAKPGQFISLYCRDGSRLLPRPISLCEIDREKGQVRIVYRTVGKGTKEFSGYVPGTEIEILGPLGNGFPIEKVQGKRVLLMGGGIGIPPMVETAKALKGSAMVTAGYRDELFLQEELSRVSELYIATEDGSAGTKGNVLHAVEAHQLRPDAIFACGPIPMLRAIKNYALEHEIPCWISMEEKMACGIGACLGCVCKSKEVDAHTHVHNKRTCVDGPVFDCTEVEL
ncbi:MAG: dihydroorotate dehydrogenase electron transfer subunit [Lachnospiraceae bacterium]